MVTIRLCGGTGNQLWQYALGLGLRARGNEVQFCRQYFDTTDSRAYTLDRFNTDVTFGQATGQEIHEPSLLYQPNILKKYDQDTTLTGYWQCPRYLEGIEPEIRKAFTLKHWPSEKSLAVANQIHNCNSVSLHIRRTDTLSPRGLAHHGLIPMEYYQRAMGHIALREDDVHFFVFSDDIEWCKANISPPFSTTFVDHNTTGVTVEGNYEVRKTDNGTEHEDLWLMSQCKHSIGANSSFGWWGSWLMQNPQKICIVPQQWFTPQSEHTAADMIPETWVRL
jgi:hypothetical protein